MRISDWSSDVCSSDLFLLSCKPIVDLQKEISCRRRLVVTQNSSQTDNSSPFDRPSSRGPVEPSRLDEGKRRPGPQPFRYAKHCNRGMGYFARNPGPSRLQHLTNAGIDSRIDLGRNTA